ncbi:MAG: Ig-like domain-containing protein [Microbacteriaceae bacterium]
MAGSNWWLRSRKAIAATTAILVVIGVPTTFAILHEGFPVTDVDLTTRDVWVTNGEQLLAGRLNRQIEELDAAVSGASPALDIVQNGNNVFMVDNVSGSMERIDPAFTRLIERVDLPASSTVVLGGTSLAVLSPAKGELWVVDVANGLDFSPTDDPAIALGAGAQVTVSPSGRVFATSPTKQALYTIDSVGAKPTKRDLAFSTKHQLTAVGDRAALLDTDSNELVMDDGTRTDLGADIGLKIQQPGKDNTSVVVASGDALLRVPLSGGEPEVTRAPLDSPVTDPTGVSSPVWLDGCAHGAWGAGQMYLLSCDGEKPQPSKIPDPTQGSLVEFRVNRSVIALNNLNNGNVWLVDNDMRLVANWDQVTPPEEDETEIGDEKSSTQSFEDTLAERTDVNRVPIARDDQFGLRPGRTTILPVLENDTDPDGDVLTITATSEIDASVGRLDYIDGARALQFTPAEGTSTVSFRYTIDDGREGVAEAYVSLKVAPLSVNGAPKEKRTTSVNLESRGTISYNVLADWIDPDGDDLTLVSASPVSGDEVRFTPDGFLTFQSKTAELGEKEVRLVVTDGALTTSGTFLVDVQPPGTLDPIGTPDYAEVFTGETVIVKPLDNDVSPSNEELTLINVDELPKNTVVSPNLERKTVGFSAEKAGTYYFFYGVAAGPKTSIGLIRVDVRDTPTEPIAPIAVKDSAYLRANEPTVVRVLSNDVSPTGLVLAVQQADTSSTDPALSVEVLNNTNIRITSSAALTEQTQFTYTISDGTNTALAGVTVVPVAPIVNRQPPVAMDDAVSVRAGDIVSVPVLGNDLHPDNSQMILEPELVDISRVGGGLAFVNGQNVRYQAPQEAGTYSATYRVADKFGESATAVVTFVVKEPNLETNLPPVPEPQTARVFAGDKVKITIPLDNLDPDGDSVMLTRFVQAPTKGVPSEQTENSFLYTADANNSGTDVVRYEVEDTYGSKAQGVISIGVIPTGETKDPPNAVDDSVEIRPGRSASVDVLLNDSDPNGASLKVTKELVEVDDGIGARVDKDSKVILTAPDVEGTFSIRYQIENGRGGVDQAFLQVRVTKDAKPIYPTAKDYYVPLDDVIAGGPVTVDLDGLIANPSGLASELEISLEGPNADIATIDATARSITVSPQTLRTAVAYRVTNTDDDLSGTAFIVIPPKVSASYSPPPSLRDDLGEMVVDMNGEREWKLADILVVPSGRPGIITTKASVVSPRSQTSAYVDKGTLRFVAGNDYRGPASITFEVTDGSDAADINGNKATLTMGFTVGDPDFKDTPPEFTTQNITVEAGEPQTVVDLRASSSHPNPALIPQFTYTDLKGQTADVSASINGGDLLISSPRGVQPGKRVTLRFQVKYDTFTVPGIVTVSVVRSTKPLPQAVEDTAKGQRGVPQPALNVLANDYNPFASSNEPLKLIDAHIENAAESSASINWTPGGDVSINPGPSFIGVVSVVYTVQDATKDPTRQAQGRYLLTVRDVPSKVNAPVATPGDLRATVTWTTPATNGENITGYTVTWTPGDGAGGGSANVSGSAASHTVTGLANGTDYRFRVVAHNVLGPSTASDQSNAARPKGQATAATALNLTTTTSGNAQLNMSWGGAGANGGEITGYRWTVFNGNTSVQSGLVAGTAASWPGNVGIKYTFSVVALATGGDSNPSAKSNEVQPGPGKPGVSLKAPGGLGNYALNGSYSAAQAVGAFPNYTWTMTPNVDNSSGNQGAPHSFSRNGNPTTTYTLTVTATVNGVSNSSSDSATTPAAEPPAPTEWGMNASTNTCPENYALNSGNFHSGGPSCDVPWVKGDFYVQCKKPTADWYRFRDGARSYGSNMLVKGDTITGPKGSVPNC